MNAELSQFLCVLLTFSTAKVLGLTIISAYYPPHCRKRACKVTDDSRGRCDHCLQQVIYYHFSFVLQQGQRKAVMEALVGHGSDAASGSMAGSQHGSVNGGNSASDSGCDIARDSGSDSGRDSGCDSGSSIALALQALCSLEESLHNAKPQVHFCIIYFVINANALF